MSPQTVVRICKPLFGVLHHWWDNGIDMQYVHTPQASSLLYLPLLMPLTQLSLSKDLNSATGAHRSLRHQDQAAVVGRTVTIPAWLFRGPGDVDSGLGPELTLNCGINIVQRGEFFLATCII